jgi:two-component system chemotaxis response regulator CheB
MQTRPLPVVMVSSLTARGTDVTLRALELGAVDFIAKPEFLSDPGLDGYFEEVAEKIRAAASARIAPRWRCAPRATPIAVRSVGASVAQYTVIVIGASTGGVEALRMLLTVLPCDISPILIAQHMPAGFTSTFAQRLDSICRIGVKEAQDGELLRRGQAYIAPGGRHMTIAQGGRGLSVRIADGPPNDRHRPSVDQLFRSAAQLVGKHCIGVMLTGMGADGASAMLELKHRGAYNIAQDEATSVVYGMPMQAINAGAVHEELALAAIPHRLVELCCGGARMREVADSLARVMSTVPTILRGA